jgi:hypothetical protein
MAFFGSRSSANRPAKAVKNLAINFCTPLQGRIGEVYNMGGSRHINCSMLEPIDLCEEISGRKLRWSYRGQTESATISGDQRCEEISATLSWLEIWV